MTEVLDLAPIGRARGTVVLPGSKSISNRTLLLAALAEGATEVRGLLQSDDTSVMLESLQKLGVQVTSPGGANCRVNGANGAFPVKQAALFLGNAGTAFRPLTAALALCGGTYRLSGVPRMHERPVGGLVDALNAAGAQIRYLGNEGFPPLEILPAQLRGDASFKVRGDVSSQFLTALLIALPLWARHRDAPVSIHVTGELISKPYIEITLNLMARFGVAVERDGWREFRIPAGRFYRSPGTIDVEGDASSASYFLAAGVLGGGPVRVEGVGKTSIQGDIRFAETLVQFGGDIRYGDNWIEASRGAAPLRALDVDLNHIPDAAMTLAVAALFAPGTTTIRNVASWRVKETDRLAAMAAELRKFDAAVVEGADHISITPRSPLPVPRAAIDTYDDHRMAMCFSLAALGGVPVRINDPQCVNKTFPGYFDALRAISHD